MSVAVATVSVAFCSWVHKSVAVAAGSGAAVAGSVAAAAVSVAAAPETIAAQT